MLVPSICGLDKLGLNVIVTDGAFVAAVATPGSKLNPSKVRRPRQDTLDTTNLRSVLTGGEAQGSLVPSHDDFVRGQLEFLS
jgi:hypothetical protein